MWCKRRRNDSPTYPRRIYQDQGPLVSLPSDLILIVAGHTDVTSLIHLSRTCQTLYGCVSLPVSGSTSPGAEWKKQLLFAPYLSALRVTMTTDPHKSFLFVGPHVRVATRLAPGNMWYLKHVLDQFLTHDLAPLPVSLFRLVNFVWRYRDNQHAFCSCCFQPEPTNLSHYCYHCSQTCSCMMDCKRCFSRSIGICSLYVSNTEFVAYHNQLCKRCYYATFE